MATKDKTPIAFNLSNIETLQYALLQEKIGGKKLSVSARFGFAIDPDSDIIRTSFDYTFITDETPVLKLEVAVDFKIEEDCFKSQIEKDKQWVIPKEFATHMAMTVVGTARGILHEKTKGTELNKFPMPAINVTGAIKNDVIIEKSNN